ncbi:MAG: glycosyltransferase family 39 protein [Deltaproteobacteria bacterium]|nr:glycosyltransferase family 39 protein [Deltaproteobacteria bacterium]
MNDERNDTPGADDPPEPSTPDRALQGEAPSELPEQPRTEVRGSEGEASTGDQLPATSPQPPLATGDQLPATSHQPAAAEPAAADRRPPTADPPPRRPPRWRRHAVGAALGIAYLAVLLSTAQEIGFARDEGFYFTAADRYQQWFDLLLKDRKQATGKEAVVSHWEMNAEHPPLMKVLFGLSHRLFHNKLGWLAPSTSYRLPGMLCGALLVYLVFVFAAKRFGELEGFLAAAFLALMPVFFYHAHLDAFDVAITLLCFLVLYAFEKSRTSNLWAFLTGILFGLALLTKLNAFFLPPTMFVIWVLRDVIRPTPATILAGLGLVVALVFQLDMRVVGALGVLLVIAVLRASDRRGGFLGLPKIPTAFLWMALLGPLMLYALWPWMWFDTLDHFRGYVNFHAKHDYYNIAYFGVNYFHPPFPIGYPFVTTALTTPVVTLLAGVVGMALFLRWRLRAMHADLAERCAAAQVDPPGWRTGLRRLLLRPWRSAHPAGPPDDEIGATQTRSPGIGIFLAVNLLVPMLIIAHPKVFIFGGTKHWMPAWPFLAIFAGVGAAWGLRRLAAVIPDRFALPRLGPVTVPVRPLLAGALSLLLLAPAAQGTAQSHPFGLSHYNLLAGGVPGSADLGMCRQFWGFTTGSLLPWLNANVPRNGAVFFHDTAWDSFRMFQTDGTLRKDIRWAGGPETAAVSLVHHELHMAELEHAIWLAYGSAAPAYVLTHHGVAIISVYAKPGVTLGYVPRADPH